jgi:hypothetical protein
MRDKEKSIDRRTLLVGAGQVAAAAQHQAGLRADVPKFTNTQLIAQRDRIVATAT